MFGTLFNDFGGLLEKHLFLGRTLLLRLQGYETCVGAGMLAPGLANAVLAQHFVLGGCWCRNVGCRASKRYAGAGVGCLAGWLVGW